MNKNEQERVETDRVLNDFESDLIQKKREFEELESMYITEKEREAMRYLIMDAEDWLEEKRSFVSLEDAKGFYERLIKSFNKVLDRYVMTGSDGHDSRKKENNLRNEKIVELFNICSSLKRNLKDVEENYQNVNANDCKTHLKSIETVENWLKKKVSEQVGCCDHDSEHNIVCSTLNRRTGAPFLWYWHKNKGPSEYCWTVYQSSSWEKESESEFYWKIFTAA